MILETKNTKKRTLLNSRAGSFITLLTRSVLGKNSADNFLKYLSIFSQKIGFVFESIFSGGN